MATTALFTAGGGGGATTFSVDAAGSGGGAAAGSGADTIPLLILEVLRAAAFSRAVSAVERGALLWMWGVAVGRGGSGGDGGGRGGATAGIVSLPPTILAAVTLFTPALGR